MRENDSGAAPEYAGAFGSAASRFCQQHAGEGFIISCGAAGQEGLAISIQKMGERYAHWPLSVSVGRDMEDDILDTLEHWWASPFAKQS